MDFFSNLRDGETTIKAKFALLMGGGGAALGAERQIVPKHCFFFFSSWELSGAV